MEYFINALKILGMDLIPIIVTIIIYFIFREFSFFKKINKWWKEVIVGVVFAAVTILSYVLAIRVGVIADKTAYVSNGTIMPILACLVFGWPSGVIAAFAGALYRGLAFDDYLRISVVVSLIFSALVGTFARLLLFKDKRTKWYNAALLGAFVETFNFLMIFIFAKNATEAYTVLSVIDIFCILGAVATLSLAMISVNLIDKKVLKIINNEDKNLSHSIATKVQHNLFIVTFAALIIVSTSTYFINARKSKEDIKDQLSLSAQNAAARFQLRYAINYYDINIVKTEKGMTYEYATLCDNQTILEKGYTIIVSKNIGEIKDRITTFQYGDIISTNSYYADPSQYSGNKFKFDDGSNLNERESGDYSDELNTKIINVKIHGIDYYCSIYPLKIFPMYGTTTQFIDFYVVCLANKEEVDSSTGISLKIAVYTQILAFIFLFAAVNFLLKKIVINKIYQVNSSLEKITNGDLNEVVKASGSKEIERLSNRINMTVDSLKLYAKKVELKMEEDLELAKKIQTTSVPTLFPIVKRYEICATMHTAKEVGGDFYDYITIDDSRIMFLVADVSGKGIPAALFMMRAKTLIKSLVMTGIPLEEVVKRANNELCNDNVAGLFVTMWIGIMNTTRGDITYVNCGHCAPIVRNDGNYSYIRSHRNFVLGAINGFDFKSDTLKLNQEDLLILYTDGVTEATNKNLELYGEERLIKMVETSAVKAFDCFQLLEIINDEVNNFQKDVEQADDITLLALKYLGDVNELVSHELTLHNNEKDILTATNFVKTFMYKNGASSKTIAKFVTAIDEVFTNKVNYAYQKKQGVIKLKVFLENRVVKVVFIDQGAKFDPTAYVSKDSNKLGLKIAKSCVDNMHYERKGNENILTLEKNI